MKIYSPTSSGKPWKITWCPPGMPRKVKDRRSKKDAMELAREIKQQLKRGEIGEVHRITKEDAELLNLCHQLHEPKQFLREAIERQKTFRRISIAECCDRYITEYDDYESVSTRDDAQRKASVIKRTLGERYIDSMTEEDIEKWRSTKLTGGNRYRNNILSHLRHLFQRARVWGYVPKGHNPAQEVPSLKIKKKEPEIWTVEDLHAALEWYLKSDSKKSASRIAFLALGAFAGMRPSEIEGVASERHGLLWEDIDFEKRHIHVRPEVAGKLAETRYISFTAKPNLGFGEDLANAIWDRLSGLLLPIKKESGPVTIIRCQPTVSAELKNNGIINHWPSDGLRHTWISCLLALGVHREWTAELAGNSPGIIKSNYRRPMPENVATSWFLPRF